MTRTYNSLNEGNTGGFGSAWSHSYEASVRASGTSALVQRPDGKRFYYAFSNGVWTADSDVTYALTQLKDGAGTTTGWTVKTPADDLETYDVSGKLLSIANRAGLQQTLAYNGYNQLSSVSDSSGRSLLFSYNQNGLIETVTDPGAGITRYAYDSVGNLISVTYPDNFTKTYHYNEASNTSGANLPFALTGITDENNIRFATYQYDVQGRAIDSEHAGGAGKVHLTYNADGSTTVTDALGTARTFTFQTILGVVKNTGISQPCSNCGSSTDSRSFDANGNLVSHTDYNGNLTCYAYDLGRNLETVHVEGFAPGSTCPADLAAYSPAANTSERKISTEWHPAWNIVKRIAEPQRITTFVWGDSAATCVLSASYA